MTGVLWIGVIIIAAHYVGRKKLLVVVALNALVGFTILYFSTKVVHVFYSQLVQGLTVAASTTLVVMFFLEHASSQHRGLLTSLKPASYSWGMWFANTIGAFFHFKYIGLFGIICSIYILITLVFMPESPYWLAHQKRYEECAKVHRWLKGTNKEAEKELNDLLNSVKDSQNIGKIKKTIKGHVIDSIKALREPETYKPSLLCLLLFAMHNLSGKMVCAVYAVEIIEKITKTESTTFAMMLILDGFTVAGLYCGCAWSKICERRKLMIVASSICAAFLFTLSPYLYLIKTGLISENTYITIALLIGYSFSACIGPISASMTLLGELFPLKHRTLMICLYSIMSKIIIGSVLKSGPYIIKTFRVHGALLFYGVCLTSCVILANKFVPETKGKSGLEVNEIFQTKTSKNKAELAMLHPS